MRPRKTPVPTRDRLKQVLEYDPLTGIFVWRVSLNTKHPAGRIAGCVEGRGYINIGIDGVIYRAHQLAYLYMTGEWPDDTVDHRNRIKSDNRWENLRPATMEEQSWNRAARSNASGFKGVRPTSSGKWYASITVGGQHVYLGQFKSAEEAHVAYLAAKAIRHPGAPLH